MNKKITLKTLKQYMLDNDLSPNGDRDELSRRMYENEIKKNNEYAKNDNAPQNLIETLFIQMKSANLLYYFNSGVIYQLALEQNNIYKTENRRQDAFTICDEYIPLSNGIINSFDDDDVLIEVITNDFELKGTPNLGFNICYHPIPISRITNIQFKTNDAKKKFIASATTFPDTYIPENLCTIVDGKVDNILVDFQSLELPPNPELDSWKIALDKFDKVMGLFAFMKNAGIFYSEITNSFEQYSDTYINVLSTINEYLSSQQKEVTIFKYILFPFDIETNTVQRQLFRQILDVIYTNKEFSLDVAIDILSNTSTSAICTAQDKLVLTNITQQFKLLANHQIAYQDIIHDENINENLPVLTLLFLSRFSNKSRQHTDKQAVRNNFISGKSGIKKSYAEYILAVLGLYYGYKNMVKEDTNISLTDPIFSSMANKIQSIKFKIENPLERILIESIFRFCATNKIFRFNYTYLNKKQKIVEPNTANTSNTTWEYYNASYELKGIPILLFQRIDRLGRLINSIQSTYPEKIKLDSYLLFYIAKTCGIDRDLLIQMLRSNSKVLSFDDLQNILRLDGQKNYK